MKIAFFSPKSMKKTLGATKNRIELAEAMREIGWETEIINYDRLGFEKDDIRNVNYIVLYRERLKDFLVINAAKYDVVLYEYDSLPYERALFNKQTLFVTRPAILYHHHLHINYPLDLKTSIKHFFTKLFNQDTIAKQIPYWDKTLEAADIIQVQNTLDKAIL